MKYGTIIRLQDGRLGTICYNQLDGKGGVYGTPTLDGIPPSPQFLLREKEYQDRARELIPGVECVGNSGFDVLWFEGIGDVGDSITMLLNEVDILSASDEETDVQRNVKAIRVLLDKVATGRAVIARAL